MSAFRCGWCGAEVSEYAIMWRILPVPSCDAHADEGAAMRVDVRRLRRGPRASEDASRAQSEVELRQAQYRYRGEVDTSGWVLF